MRKRRRLKRKVKPIGYWRVPKSLNPPWVLISRVKWGELPKEAYHPKGKVSSHK